MTKQKRELQNGWFKKQLLIINNELSETRMDKEITDEQLKRLTDILIQFWDELYKVDKENGTNRKDQNLNLSALSL